MKKARKKPKASTSPRLWYTVDEAAVALRMARSTLYLHIASGKIASRQIGGRRLIPASVIEEGASHGATQGQER